MHLTASNPTLKLEWMLWKPPCRPHSVRAHGGFLTCGGATNVSLTDARTYCTKQIPSLSRHTPSTLDRRRLVGVGSLLPTHGWSQAIRPGSKHLYLPNQLICPPSPDFLLEQIKTLAARERFCALRLHKRMESNPGPLCKVLPISVS